MPSNPDLTPLFSRIVDDGHSSTFIPVCLYSRNLLRVSQVEKLVQAFEQFDIRATFVIADYLHGLNLMIRGYRAETAARNAETTGNNVLKMVQKVIIRESNDRTQVCRWAQIASKLDFVKLLANVESAFGTTKELADLADQFTQFQKGRTEWRFDERASEAERRYLCSEIAMSVYMTEMVGHCCELWEEPPVAGGPDPLAQIYQRYQPLLKDWTGRTEICRSLYRLPTTW